MSTLNNSELLLLSNLIYLNLNIFKEKELGIIIKSMLYKGMLNEAMITDSQCIQTAKKDEFTSILRQIENDTKLNNLKVYNLENDISGVKSACFIGNNKSDVTVVFRGTKNATEWKDNGQGAYKIDTTDQLNALNYINNLSFNNITVTGHSKGGNKAKYVALLSNKVKKCTSFDGQGFSNEFMDKYNTEIIKNKSKITSINAKYDYVNCLLNSLNEEKIYIETHFQKNPLYYHKCTILLDGNGNLNNETNGSFFLNSIYEFFTSLILELPQPYKSFSINGITGLVELILCRKGIQTRIIELVKNVLITFGYTKYYHLENKFAIEHHILQSFAIPFTFLSEFIKIEETHNCEMLEAILIKIKNNYNNIISKLKILGYEGEKVAFCIDYASNELISKLQTSN